MYHTHTYVSCRKECSKKLFSKEKLIAKKVSLIRYYYTPENIVFFLHKAIIPTSYKILF